MELQQIFLTDNTWIDALEHKASKPEACCHVDVLYCPCQNENESQSNICRLCSFNSWAYKFNSDSGNDQTPPVIKSKAQEPK